MRILTLALDGVFDTGLATVLDTFTQADALSALDSEAGPRFELAVVGSQAEVRTQQGLRLEAVPLGDAAATPAPDVVVVPALGVKSPAELGEALERDDVLVARARLREWHAAGARVAAACTATYVLAAAGLLDGLRATTTWWLAPDFRARFPAVTLDDSRMVVATDGVVTAGAALAHVDLALWLVRDSSPSLARKTARYLLFDGRPSQASYAMADHLQHSDPVVERFERWAREHLRDFSMAEAARSVGASERTLQRRIRRALGRSPIAFVQDLRVEQAVHRLETTDETLEAIATDVGYQDAVTLGTLLRRKTGRGIRELRGLE